MNKIIPTTAIMYYAYKIQSVLIRMHGSVHFHDHIKNYYKKCNTILMVLCVIGGNDSV